MEKKHTVYFAETLGQMATIEDLNMLYQPIPSIVVVVDRESIEKFLSDNTPMPNKPSSLMVMDWLDQFFSDTNLHEQHTTTIGSDELIGLRNAHHLEVMEYKAQHIRQIETEWALTKFANKKPWDKPWRK